MTQAYKPSTRPHRALVRVERVIGAHAWVIVPGFDPRQGIRVALETIPEPVRSKLAPGVRVHARVNIGAESPEDLVFDDWESR